MDQLLGEIIDKFEIFILILVRMAGLFLMSPVLVDRMFLLIQRWVYPYCFPIWCIVTDTFQRE